MAVIVPQLDWRVIGPRDYTNGDVSVEGYVRTINELVTNSSFWRTISLDVTSSNAAAIVIAPKAGLPLEGMRVLFAGGFTDTNQNLFAIRSAGTPETHVANNIYVGFTPSTSASYVAGGWTTAAPFGATGSLNRWSKYWSIGNFNNTTSMFLVESQEVLLLQTLMPGTIAGYGCVVGAPLLGYDATSSEGGRIFGMHTTGNTAPASNFWAVTSNWLAHNGTANNMHFGAFEVLNGVGLNTWFLINRQTAMTFAAQYPGETTTSNGTATGIGQHMVRVTGDSAVGFLRQIYAHQDRFAVSPGLVLSGSVNRSDSKVIGAYISYGSHTTPTDTMLLISTGSQNVG